MICLWKWIQMEAESDHLVGYQIEVMNYAAVNSDL